MDNYINPIEPIINSIFINNIEFREINNMMYPGVAPGQYINIQGIIYAPNYRYKYRYPVYGCNRYARLRLYLINGKCVNTSVHRLIMLAFSDLPYNVENLVVNHKDGNKRNNDISNLEWATNSENVRHAIITGLSPIGENSPKSKLTEKEVIEICKELEKPRYYGQFTELSKKYHISDAAIHSIAKGENWTHISKNYNIDFSQKGMDSILTKDQVIEICEELSKKSYRGQLKDLANKYNVSPSTIREIKYRRSWTSISKQYTF